MSIGNSATGPGSLQQENAWSQAAAIVFRILFIYFFIQAVPLDWKFYRDLFVINWSRLQFFDIFNIAHYAPRFSSQPQTYADWGIVLLLSVVGSTGWTFISRGKKVNYSQLYYWLRVLVRYRLAIAVIAYGFIKFYPIQAPYPSFSNLNTSYGDFTRWKLFSLSLGIVPGYESFLGSVEIVTGLLLLYRRTASIGAFIILIFTGNVFVSNLAYEGGEQVYSLYLISLALFVLAYDIQRLTRLLVLQQPVRPNTFKPVYPAAWQPYGRIVLKTVFILFFVVLYGFKSSTAYEDGPFRFPTGKALAGTPGIYNVSSFRINKDSLAYSATDTVRWKDVVFEKWNTISIRSNQPVQIDSNNIEKFVGDSTAKDYELEGSSGRQYYSYTADTLQHTLLLRNKNKHYNGETLLFHYRLAGDSAIALSGINERNDSVFVVLNKIKKKYLLEEVTRTGRQKPIKL